mmetsp:Transcript_18277/g.34922  ORF Transcript_18277/g.34922 Transcript_18277/m.34922 type:complete len:615 (+) Transcript_18277:992-2836(+)
MVELAGQVHAEVVQEKWLLLQVELDGLVEHLGVGHLVHSLLEQVVRPAHRGVVHEGFDSVIVLAVVRVQVHDLEPLLVFAARVQQLGDVEAGPVVLDVLHELLLLVFAVADTQLSVDALVGSLELDTRFQHLNKLVEVAVIFVVLTQFHKVIGVHNDVHGTALGKLEFLRVHTGETNFLPHGNLASVVGGFHSVLELLEVHVAKCKLGVVLDVFVDDLRGQVELFVEQPLANIRVLGVVLRVEEVLELSILLCLSIRVNKLVVQDRVLELRSGHKEEVDEFLVKRSGLGSENDIFEVLRILGLEERADSLLDHLCLQLRLTQDDPYIRLVPVLSEVRGFLDVFLALQEDLNSLNTHLELLVDEECLVVELVLRVGSNLGNLRTIVVVETVDVVHNSGLVRLDSRKDQQVLEVAVVTELLTAAAGVVKNQALKQFNELVRQVGVHESLDGDGHLLRALGGRESGGNDLVDEFTAVLVLFLQNLGPEVHVFTHNEVLRLILEETILGGDLNELVVASAHGFLVGHHSEHGVAALAERTDHSRIVHVVLEEEGLGLLSGASVDIDLRETVVDFRVLAFILRLGLEPWLKNDEAVDLFALANEFGDELGIVGGRTHGF